MQRANTLDNSGQMRSICVLSFKYSINFLDFLIKVNFEQLVLLFVKLVFGSKFDWRSMQAG